MNIADNAVGTAGVAPSVSLRVQLGKQDLTLVARVRSVCVAPLVIFNAREPQALVLLFLAPQLMALEPRVRIFDFDLVRVTCRLKF